MFSLFSCSFSSLRSQWPSFMRRGCNFCSILWVISLSTSEFSLFLMLDALTPVTGKLVATKPGQSGPRGQFVLMTLNWDRNVSLEKLQSKHPSNLKSNRGQRISIIWIEEGSIRTGNERWSGCACQCVCVSMRIGNGTPAVVLGMTRVLLGLAVSIWRDRAGSNAGVGMGEKDEEVCAIFILFLHETEAERG